MATRVELVRALQEGRVAGRNLVPLKECPYGAEDLRRAAWIRGHVQGRPGPDGAAD